MKDEESSKALDNTLITQACAWVNNDSDARVYMGLLLEHIPVLVSAIAADGSVVFASRHHSLLAGVPAEIHNAQTEPDLYPAFVQTRLAELQDQDLNGDGEQVWELSAKHKDGTMHLYRMRRVFISHYSDGRAELSSASACINCVTFTIGIDVTEHKEAENALRDHQSHINYVTFHDPLTGLANRSLFYDRMKKSISRARRSDTGLAIMLLDLDRFKNINDSLGHDAGDAFLKHIARSLTEELRDTDTVARLGGDEFVIALENITEIESVQKIAEKLLASLSQPVNMRGHEIVTTASIGVSVFPADGDSVDQLLKHADTAMYRAKAAGKNRFQFFVQAMSDNAVNYLLLENDLRRAIEQDELLLFYQPQIDLNNGQIIGVEALVRWQHRVRGLVSPVHFIPLAEETGLIEPLGDWVLRHACERFQAWLDAGLNLGKISVNLSTRQFRQESFETTVQKILTETGLPAEYLELEITETSAMENAASSIETLKCLSDMGLSLAIDDFGTGYSSLSYLQRFPIQKLKIDRSFIVDVDNDMQEAAIAKSIIDLAHNMCLQVIAEGVERPSQSKWLIARGCDQVQGFYYSRPLSEEALLEFVNDPVRATRYHDCVRLRL